MDKKEKFIILCDAALAKIVEAIRNHERNEPADLSLSLLHTIRGQILQMKIALDANHYQPTYERFVLDWPDEHGLIRELTELAYQYGRLQKSRPKS
jgi:hypothetical protein